MVVIVKIEKTYGDNNNHGQNQQSDVIKTRVMIEKMMIVVLFNKEVVVLLNN